MKPFCKYSLAALLPASLLLASGPALSQATTTYEYDALGRLTGTSTTGGTNDGLATDYEYDPAGNRSRVVVTGSSNDPPGTTKIIVLPINGFLVIPVSN
ncbi:YD repeat-containing protein [Parasphingorhabdus marina DSM 22363]|uniref:YD repeat-containing protein n=1 Tax=Parasphingorhabdus marina DSM 22363 TaxID=1123272 RepID=A0A1N6HMH3_9SPHN|nr:hypothetical protein [Parasphingorhabdus marina]SIO20971.1 YD repeat-containing protein [Parasphingorhabdus marina DSM 22363]